jgi:hypothetical protein
MMAISCWPPILFAGATAPFVCGALFLTRSTGSLPALAIMGTWVVGLGLQQVVWGGRRRGPGRGDAVASGEIRRTGITRGQALFTAAIIGAGVLAEAAVLALALSDLISGEAFGWVQVLLVTGYALLVPAGWFFWYAARTRLWELWYMGGTFLGLPLVLGSLLIVLSPSPGKVNLFLVPDCMSVLCLSAAAAMFPGGLFLRHRWRTLGGSSPAEPAAPET